ncbi:MAG: acyltransferase family protein [Steroidobacteraceae bacterium]
MTNRESSPAHMQKSNYRREIDGLRGIAVLGVIFFHAGIHAVGGGYSGVDVFFVISGFLITQFIDSRIAGGRFSIGEFYERRIRRIIPALAAVCAFTWAVSYALLLPLDFRSYGASLLATATFLSNAFFWHKSGYFAAPAATEPLLHTWSLAVEEQFYIVFPLFMALLARFGRAATKSIITAVLALSFVLSVVAVRYAPSFAFYLAPPRAWELLIGSLLALGAVPVAQSAVWRSIVSLTGLSLIALSLFLYTPNTPFPGAAALAPCLGTAFIIWAEGPSLTPVGRCLGTKPLVWTGLISYSLYLWHWPMIVFVRYVIERSLRPAEVLGIILVSIAVASASWKFIEQPFRGRGAPFSRRQLFAGTAAVGAAFCAAALVAYAGKGLPYRINRQALAYDRGSLDFSPERARCLLSSSTPLHFCAIGRNGSPSFIVWGDSHAAAMLPAFQADALRSGVAGEFAAMKACPPLLAVHRTDDPQRTCERFNDAVLGEIRRSDFHTVFLVARWSINAMGDSQYELDNGLPQVFIEDKHSASVSLAENQRVFSRGLYRTLDALRGREVIIMLEAPDPDVMVPTYLAREANAGMIGDKVRLPFDTLPAYHEVQKLIEPLAKEFGATVLDPSRVLCRSDRCLIASGGHSLYVDNQHLSVHGAALLRRLIAPEISPLSTLGKHHASATRMVNSSCENSAAEAP